MKTLKVKKLNKDAILPTRAHPQDAGLDLFALEDIFCDIGSRCTVPTGIAVSVDPGYFAMISDKSSVARTGLKVTAGVVDSGYTGECCVELLNVTAFAKLIKKGQKIAQMLILPIALPEVVETSILESSERGDKGWGSTGKF
jgi:dUTP pyrophosphatase